jgi:hypothetical protein
MTTVATGDLRRVEIVPAKNVHAYELLSTGLLAAEVREIEAAGLTPEAVVYQNIETSAKAWALLADATPVAMWGVSPWPGHQDVGALWFVSTEDFSRHFRLAQRVAEEYIREMGEAFPVLSGYVDVRRTEVIGWLRRAGFRFDTSETRVGPHMAPFVQFGRRG